MPIIAIVHSEALKALVISREKMIRIRNAIEGKYRKEHRATTIPILNKVDFTCLLL
jgi:hypothetical protein